MFLLDVFSPLMNLYMDVAYIWMRWYKISNYRNYYWRDHSARPDSTQLNSLVEFWKFQNSATGLIGLSRWS